MGSAATTSRVREAIAAAQLFFHRYLLDLQPVTLRPGDDGLPARPDEVKAELRRWWDWMRNYRVWEANRKVYLYPENYLRPELRDTKTPAFAALEDDLLQGEITPASAERAYRRYLDEYTEVSRLTIAGGYVHEPEDDERAALAPGAVRPDEDRPSPVLLPPRRVLPRGEPLPRSGTRGSRSTSRSTATGSTPWSPSTGCSCSGRRSRTSPTPRRRSSFTEHHGRRDAVAHRRRRRPTHVVRIYYSFYNLNKEWVPAQVLATDRPIQDNRPISDVRLLVERSAVRRPPGWTAADDGRETIVVRCSYAGSGGRDDDRAADRRLQPHPGAVHDAGRRRSASTTAARGTSPASSTSPSGRACVRTRLAVAAPTVVMFNKPAESSEGPWFSFDYKGGSFLCKPAPLPPVDDERVPVRGDGERLPDWDRFRPRSPARAGRPGSSTPPASTSRSTRRDRRRRPACAQPVRPRRATGSPPNGVVDAVSIRGGTPTCSRGAEYFRYSGEPFGGAGHRLPEAARVEHRRPAPLAAGGRGVHLARRHVLLLLERPQRIRVVGGAPDRCGRSATTGAR